MKRNCNNCQKEYEADMRNVNRGWGLCCSKSCAASKREKSKPGYDPKKVEFNNMRRENWNSKGTTLDGKVTGRTSEGYRIIGNVAYDEFDEPMYSSEFIDEHPFSNQD